VLEGYGGWLRERFGAARPKPRLELPVIPLGVDCDSLPAPRRARPSGPRRAHGSSSGRMTSRSFSSGASRITQGAPVPMYLALEAAAKKTGKPLVLILAGYFFNDSIKRGSSKGGAPSTALRCA